MVLLVQPSTLHFHQQSSNRPLDTKDRHVPPSSRPLHIVLRIRARLTPWPRGSYDHVRNRCSVPARIVLSGSNRTYCKPIAPASRKTLVATPEGCLYLGRSKHCNVGSCIHFRFSGAWYRYGKSRSLNAHSSRTHRASNPNIYVSKDCAHDFEVVPDGWRQQSGVLWS